MRNEKIYYLRYSLHSGIKMVPVCVWLAVTTSGVCLCVVCVTANVYGCQTRQIFHFIPKIQWSWHESLSSFLSKIPAPLFVLGLPVVGSNRSGVNANFLKFPLSSNTEFTGFTWALWPVGQELLWLFSLRHTNESVNVHVAWTVKADNETWEVSSCCV